MGRTLSPRDLAPVDWIDADWEEDAPPNAGLPTEKRREAAHRTLAFRDLRQRIATGDINDADAAVSANLNLVQLALDWAARQTAPAPLRTAWEALTNLKVLDPTCGSGAFLLAAMKVLEELYASVFQGIRHCTEGHTNPDPVLQALLADARGNSDYFLRKSIALHNLYGVDILDEAVEIARLRLFLALVAVVDRREGMEPLPDLDMNIRCGNVLVGCTDIEDLQRTHDGDLLLSETVADIKAQAVDLRAACRRFLIAQETESRAAALIVKADLQDRTDALAVQLDRLYALRDSDAPDWHFDSWRRTHQPFHWLAEFPEAMLAGGFDVVAGNPPFVGRTKVSYTYRGFATDAAPDIFAPCLERSARLLADGGRLAMIAPIALVRGSQKGYAQLRRMLGELLPALWVSVYDLRPDKLFKAQVRPVILLGHAGGRPRILSSNLRRWRSEYREHLFDTIQYAETGPEASLQGAWPLLGDPAASGLLRALSSSGKSIGHWVRKRGKFKLGRKTVMNRRFITVFLQEPPCWEMLDAGMPGRRVRQTEVHWMGFDEELHQHAAFLIGAGRLGHWLWTTIGDAFHVTPGMVEWFPCDLERLRPIACDIAALSRELSDHQMNAPMVDRNKKFVGGYDLGACRDVTDRADRLIMEQLGVGDYWPTVLALDNRIVKSAAGSATSLNRWVRDWTPTQGPWQPGMPE